MTRRRTPFAVRFLIPFFTLAVGLEGVAPLIVAGLKGKDADEILFMWTAFPTLVVTSSFDLDPGVWAPSSLLYDLKLSPAGWCLSLALHLVVLCLPSAAFALLLGWLEGRAT